MNSSGGVLKINHDMFISLLSAQNSNIEFTERMADVPPKHDVYTYLGRINVNKYCFRNN
jgi:hypothetical protein